MKISLSSHTHQLDHFISYIILVQYKCMCCFNNNHCTKLSMLITSNYVGVALSSKHLVGVTFCYKHVLLRCPGNSSLDLDSTRLSITFSYRISSNTINFSCSPYSNTKQG